LRHEPVQPHRVNNLDKMPAGNLSRLLLKLFAKGELFGTTVHDLAAAAWEAGWGRQDTFARKLVGAGRGGKRRNMIADDIIKAAESEGLVHPAEPSEINISTGGTALVYLSHEFVPKVIEGSDPSLWCLSPQDIASGQGLAGLLREWAETPDVEFSGDLSQVLAVQRIHQGWFRQVAGCWLHEHHLSLSYAAEASEAAALRHQEGSSVQVWLHWLPHLPGADGSRGLVYGLSGQRPDAHLQA
jgi:hypothetical protein